MCLLLSRDLYVFCQPCVETFPADRKSKLHGYGGDKTKTDSMAALLDCPGVELGIHGLLIDSEKTTMGY